MTKPTSPSHVIALDVGGSSIKSGVVSLGRVPRVSDRRSTPIDHTAPADSLIHTFAAIIAGHLAQAQPVRGVGMGIPNPFDYTNGISHMQHKYSALQGQNLTAALRAALARPSLPFAYRNDAEAAIIGEVFYGAGSRQGRVLGITLGTGLGAAFVADGRPLTGHPDVPPGGELWHIPLAGGVADDHFSARGIERVLRAADPSLVDTAAAAEHARAGDARLRQAFADFGAALGSFLAPYINRFGAQNLLVLGGIGRALDLFGPAVAAQVGVPVKAGALGADAPLLGAAELLQDSMA